MSQVTLPHFRRTPSREYAEQLKRVHPRARFVFAENEQTWWVATKELAGPASDPRLYKMHFRLMREGIRDPMTGSLLVAGRRTEPSTSACASARVFFLDRLYPERHAIIYLKEKQRRARKEHQDDMDETRYTMRDTLSWLYRDLRRKGHDVSQGRAKPRVRKEDMDPVSLDFMQDVHGERDQPRDKRDLYLRGR